MRIALSGNYRDHEWVPVDSLEAVYDEGQRSIKDKEQRNQWHVGRNEHPVYYLDFGDLGLLIINHWTVFKDFFDSQVWVQSRISEAERTRNVIAHTNVLAAEEGERLEMYLRDWMKQVS